LTSWLKQLRLSSEMYPGNDWVDYKCQPKVHHRVAPSIWELVSRKLLIEESVGTREKKECSRWKRETHKKVHKCRESTSVQGGIERARGWPAVENTSVVEPTVGWKGLNPQSIGWLVVTLR
jgi:hypothetical protein